MTLCTDRHHFNSIKGKCLKWPYVQTDITLTVLKENSWNDLMYRQTSLYKRKTPEMTLCTDRHHFNSIKGKLLKWPYVQTDIFNSIKGKLLKWPYVQTDIFNSIKGKLLKWPYVQTDITLTVLKENSWNDLMYRQTSL